MGACILFWKKLLIPDVELLVWSPLSRRQFVHSSSISGPKLLQVGSEHLNFFGSSGTNLQFSWLLF